MKLTSNKLLGGHSLSLSLVTREILIDEFTETIVAGLFGTSQGEAEGQMCSMQVNVWRYRKVRSKGKE